VLNDLGAALKGILFVAGVADEEYGILGAQEIGENGPKACIDSLEWTRAESPLGWVESALAASRLG
jgi:hypothetical protein